MQQLLSISHDWHPPGVNRTKRAPTHLAARPPAQPTALRPTRPSAHPLVGSPACRPTRPSDHRPSAHPPASPSRSLAHAVGVNWLLHRVIVLCHCQTRTHHGVFSKCSIRYSNTDPPVEHRRASACPLARAAGEVYCFGSALRPFARPPDHPRAARAPTRAVPRPTTRSPARPLACWLRESAKISTCGYSACEQASTTNTERLDKLSL